MTWTPETNRITWGLLTPEEQGAMLAAKHGWLLADYNGWAEDRHPTWSPDRVYRAIPAPVDKPLVDPAIWRFLPEEKKQ